VFRVFGYCLLESLAHANIATVPPGEMTTEERWHWQNTGVSWNTPHAAELRAWEDRPWEIEPNWQSQQYWSSQSAPAGSHGTSWAK